MGLSGDWRDTRWGHAVYAAIVVASAGAAVATDHQFDVLIRALGALAALLGTLLLVYSVLRLTGFLPRQGRGRRRLGKNNHSTDT